MFVLGRNGVEGIVTLADLQKQPVRLLLFAAVSLLEMAMLAKIRNACAEEEWIGTLTADRIEKARYLQEERRKKNQDLDLVDCLQLCDKTTILIENDALRAECGFLSMKKPQKFFKSAQSLRDNLAHGQDPTDGSNWANVCELLTGIDTITHQIAGKDDSPTLCETGDEQ